MLRAIRRFERPEHLRNPWAEELAQLLEVLDDLEAVDFDGPEVLEILREFDELCRAVAQHQFAFNIVGRESRILVSFVAAPPHWSYKAGEAVGAGDPRVTQDSDWELNEDEGQVLEFGENIEYYPTVGSARRGAIAQLERYYILVDTSFD